MLTPLAHEVPADYFDVLGVQALRGRTFVAGEDQAGPDNVVVISYSLWKLAGETFDPGRDYTAYTLVVLPRYFETVRNPLLSGRGITEVDTADSMRVAVVTRELAHRYFADRDPVGRSIRLSGAMAGEWRVVGVAADIAGAGNQPEPQPAVYLPHPQAPVGTMSFLLRTRVAPASLGRVAERTLWSTGPPDERLSHHDSRAGRRGGPLAEPFHHDPHDAVCGAGPDSGDPKINKLH